MIPDKNTCSPAGMSIYTELIRIMKESTQEYYNMRIALGLECILEIITLIMDNKDNE